MPTMYTLKQSPAQKKASPNVASVLDSSSHGESLQRKADMANNAAQRAEAPRPNNTGMPNNLKAGIESLSEFSMDDMRVLYNSSKFLAVRNIDNKGNKTAQRKIDCTKGEFVNHAKTFEKFRKRFGTKSRSVENDLGKLWEYLNASIESFNMDDVVKDLVAYDYDFEKFKKTIEKKEGVVIDHGVLSGDDAHGGAKHYAKSEKERIKRMREDGVSKDTSVISSVRTSLFYNYVKNNLKSHFVELLSSNLWPILSNYGFRAAAKTATNRNLNPLVDPSGKITYSKTYEMYDLTVNVDMRKLTSQDLKIHFDIKPALVSVDEYDVEETEMETHTTYKKNTHVSFNHVASSKKLKMYWGGNKIQFDWTVSDDPGQFSQLLQDNFLSGITLY